MTFLVVCTWIIVGLCETVLLNYYYFPVDFYLDPCLVHIGKVLVHGNAGISRRFVTSHVIDLILNRSLVFENTLLACLSIDLA